MNFLQRDEDADFIVNMTQLLGIELPKKSNSKKEVLYNIFYCGNIQLFYDVHYILYIKKVYI